MTMLGPQRHREILERVQRLGSVRVVELARDLQVTEETIRRDLEKLDGEGKLLRIHGGALRLTDERHELPFDVRQTVHLEAKRVIARSAVHQIDEGDVIALDASSTARELARLVPDVSLTVITNGLAVISALTDRSRARVVSTGGLLDPPSLSFVGTHALEGLERFHIHKAFISCKGVDLERGLSVAADGHATIKRRMIELADTTILLADASKLASRAVEFFARLDQVDLLITDGAADPGILREIKASGLHVETTEAASRTGA